VWTPFVGFHIRNCGLSADRGQVHLTDLQKFMDTTILARFQCAISETMMASAASLRIGRAAHFPWWLAELQHAAHAPRASHSSAMQLGLRDLPARTFRVPRQGAKPARAQSGPLLAHLRIPVSKRPANGDAKAHSSHPEMSRWISS
jgi:hypothetical protein